MQCWSAKCLCLREIEMPRRYWLFKSEPNVYSIEDLKNEKDQIGGWEGVRNYQARNLLRDEIKKGDRVLFYHSRIKPMAVVGTATVVKEGYPDHEQFDSKAKYFDPKADPKNPRWYQVDIQYRSSFKRPVTLSEMRDYSELKDMMLLRKGSRLSIQPVSSEEWRFICKLGGVRA